MVSSYLISFGETNSIPSLFNFLDRHFINLWAYCYGNWPGWSSFLTPKSLIIILTLLLILFFFGKAAAYYVASIVSAYCKVAICGILIPFIAPLGAFSRTRWVVVAWLKILSFSCVYFVIATMFMCMIVKSISTLMENLYSKGNLDPSVGPDYLYVAVGVIVLSAVMTEVQSFVAQLLETRPPSDSGSKAVSNVGGLAAAGGFAAKKAGLGAIKAFLPTKQSPGPLYSSLGGASNAFSSRFPRPDVNRVRSKSQTSYSDGGGI